MWRRVASSALERAPRHSRRALLHFAPAQTIHASSCGGGSALQLSLQAPWLRDRRSTALSLSCPRFYSIGNEPAAGDDGDVPASDADATGAPGVESPGDKFVMIYTCKVCETRSAKTISKHAYYSGVVLVRCPGCENLHLVADRLGWFEDESTDVESLLRQRGESIRYVTSDNVLELTERDLTGPPSGEQ